MTGYQIVGVSRQPGDFKLVLQRAPVVLLRRCMRALLMCCSYHRKNFLVLLGLVIMVLICLAARSPADNWDTFEYLTCIFGLKSFFVNQNLNNIVNVYSVHRSSYDKSDCLRLPAEPSPFICIHSIEIDRYISGAILDGTVWEVQSVELFQEVLRKNPLLNLIDMGAHIGQYSLLAASMGRSVVTVEPYIKHVRMIHKAVVLNGFQDKFTLVHNALSDSNRHVSLQFKKDNRGAIRIVESNSRLQYMLKQPEDKCVPSESSVNTITMNDLVSVVPFKNAILKIDIEGHEVRALRKSGIFLETLHIPFIIMEWYFLGHANDEFKVQSVQATVDYMVGYNYQAYTTDKKPLNMSGTAWTKWPEDIVWKLVSANF